MKTEKVLLSQVKVNAANPRTIKEHKLHLLMERMIVFPKMLTLRPVVVDDTMMALGGNMRIKALMAISELTLDEIGHIAAKTKNYQRLTKAEQELLLQRWQVWLDKPTVEIARASELTDAEKQEFIIADNSSFGEWDYDALANEWDSDELRSWGVDVWNPEKPSHGFAGIGGGAQTPAEAPFDTDDLPPELQGQDIEPDELPKVEGNDETVMQRIIIVYPQERERELAEKFGLEEFDKVVYNIDEILG